MTVTVDQRVKDRAGHFGTVIGLRKQPNAIGGDAALVRWESHREQDSWAYVKDLTPVRAYGARGNRFASSLAVADYIENAGRSTEG